MHRISRAPTCGTLFVCTVAWRWPSRRRRIGTLQGDQMHPSWGRPGLTVGARAGAGTDGRNAPDAKGAFWLEAFGLRALYVDNARVHGDPYHCGFIKVPLLLAPGSGPPAPPLRYQPTNQPSQTLPTLDASICVTTSTWQEH
eukprot:7039124-Pyramimonas_sp.AAC.1